MKIKNLLFLTLILFSGCNAQGSNAVATLKFKNAEIQIRREHIHPFLAEYDRYLSLIVDGKSVKEIQISTDTGGYSQANVFATNGDLDFIVQDRMGRYGINIKNQKIEDLKSVCENSKDDIFIGTFDRDESKKWRFISATERKYTSMLVSGCAEKF